MHKDASGRMKRYHKDETHESQTKGAPTDGVSSFSRSRRRRPVPLLADPLAPGWVASRRNDFPFLSPRVVSRETPQSQSQLDAAHQASVQEPGLANSIARSQWHGQTPDGVPRSFLVLATSLGGTTDLVSGGASQATDESFPGRTENSDSPMPTPPANATCPPPDDLLPWHGKPPGFVRVDHGRWKIVRQQRRPLMRMQQ